MDKLARAYKRITLRRLDTLSGNQCAEPKCNKLFIANDEISIISKICHIEAASKGGARYNPRAYASPIPPFKIEARCLKDIEAFLCKLLMDWSGFVFAL